MSDPLPLTLDAARSVRPIDLESARAELAKTARVETARTKAERTENHVKFEAMVLGSFMESMLPKENPVYGGGMAGGMWKSMLAQELGRTMAERGGIGIADRLLGDRYAADAKPEAVTADRVAR